MVQVVATGNEDDLAAVHGGSLRLMQGLPARDLAVVPLRDDEQHGELGGERLARGLAEVGARERGLAEQRVVRPVSQGEDPVLLALLRGVGQPLERVRAGRIELPGEAECAERAHEADRQLHGGAGLIGHAAVDAHERRDLSGEAIRIGQ